MENYHNCRPISVLMWGHSFIRRLEIYCQGAPLRHNMGLAPETHLVFSKSRGGCTTIQARLDFKIIDQVQADMMVIDIGTNDLDSRRLPPNVLAEQVFQAAKVVSYMYPSVQKIIILEVLFRTSSGTYPRRNPNFTGDAHQYNNKIKLLINDQPDRASSKIVFWHHKGLVQNWPQYIQDGVHLNPAGMAKYYKSVRRAILHFSPVVRSKMTR